MGVLYELMFRYVPFFYIFKSPVEKFGVLSIFVMFVLLLSLFKGLESSKKNLGVFGLLGAYLVCCSIPVITGNLIPDYRLNSNFEMVSRRYIDKAGYKIVRSVVSDELPEYRILTLPGGANYQVCLKNYQNKYYTGMDPVSWSLSKPFLAPYNAPPMLYSGLSHENYRKLFSLYNIRKVMINTDMVPWFGFIEQEGIPEMDWIFSKFMKKRTMDSIILYDNNDDPLPYFYSSD